MTRILIIYGTTDGHTTKVAQALAAIAQADGALVDVVRAGTRDPDAGSYDGVIVAASVNRGGYQKPVRRWVAANSGALTRMPNAFVSVCLGVLQKDPRVDAELTAIAERFFVQTGWRPMTIEVVAGALPYTRYGWFKRRMMRRIAAAAGGGVDTTRDYEYTDWAALAVVAHRFVALVKGQPLPPASSARAIDRFDDGGRTHDGELAHATSPSDR